MNTFMDSRYILTYTYLLTAIASKYIEPITICYRILKHVSVSRQERCFYYGWKLSTRSKANACLPAMFAHTPCLWDWLMREFYA